MSLLLAGIALWCLVHLVPSLLPTQRNALVARLGDKAYRGGFSVLILGALLLIIFGWKAAQPTPVYSPPFGPNPLISALVLAGLFLFFSARAAGNVKRIIRHPQMTGTILWGVAHLLTNGDSRSLALFGGLSTWAALEILLINRRDGAWQRPPAAPVKRDLVPLAVGIVVFILVAVFHQRLFGVPAIPI